MKKKLLISTFVFGVLLSCSKGSFSQITAASATYQPVSGTNIPGNVVITGDIQANEQSGTLEAYNYASTTTAVSDATGFQRLRSIVAAPSLPYGNVYDPNFYVEYKVKPADLKFLRITSFKVTVMGGGSGNVRLVAKYSVNNTDFNDLPVSGNYFTVDGAAANFAASEADPVVLVNNGGAANTESKRTLTFSNLAINLIPGQFFTLRLYPFLIDVAAPANVRYLLTRQLVISALASPTTLPLDFLSFTAKPDALGKTVNLNWSTANEVNTKNFEIQKRTGTTEFVTIGKVDSKNTAGVHNYSYVDNNATSGTAYYRILQFDNNDSSKPSAVVSVTNRSEVTLSIYPNPVGDVLNVNHASANQSATFKVLSLDGKVIFQQGANANASSTSLNVSQLTSGAYMLVFDNNGSSSVKFIKK